MRYDGKIAIELKDVLDYLGIQYDKWKEVEYSYETHILDPAEHQKNSPHTVLPPGKNT